MRIIWIALIAGVFALPASGQPANELARVSQDWAQDWQAKELMPTLSLYTDDATFVDASGLHVSGKRALRQLFKQVLRRFSAEPKLHSLRSASSGDLGYDWGDYSETLRPVADPEHPIKTHGTYLVILKRVSGHWLIANQTWTGNVPVPVNQ